MLLLWVRFYSRLITFWGVRYTSPSGGRLLSGFGGGVCSLLGGLYHRPYSFRLNQNIYIPNGYCKFHLLKIHNLNLGELAVTRSDERNSSASNRLWSEQGSSTWFSPSEQSPRRSETIIAEAIQYQTHNSWPRGLIVQSARRGKVSELVYQNNRSGNDIRRSGNLRKEGKRTAITYRAITNVCLPRSLSKQTC